MYFEDLKLDMTVQIAPAVIEKDKMLEFARQYDNIPLHTDEAYADGLWWIDRARCDVIYDCVGEISGAGSVWQGTAGRKVYKN